MRRTATLTLTLALAVVAAAWVIGNAAPASAELPDPALDDSTSIGSGPTNLVVAGGCFWGIEEVFQHVRGVTEAVSGYAGGSERNAKYDLVSSGTTGHAESVKITYDPSKISAGQLLKVFFSVAHDPTQRGGQGPDTGPQYRSAIFYAGTRQQQIAKAYIEQLTGAKVFKREITTQVVPLTAFYEAEPYHQDYAVKNPKQPYIVINDLPKVDELRKQLPQLYVK